MPVLRYVTGASLTTIGAISILAWLTWSMGVTAGAHTAMNDTADITDLRANMSKAHHKALAELQENKSDAAAETPLFAGFSAVELTDMMLRLGERGIEYGYAHPERGRVIAVLMRPVAGLQFVSLLALLTLDIRSQFE